MGALLALATAWPAAIVGLTILPTLLGHPMSIGSVCLGFNGRCDPALVAGSTILSAAGQYVQSVSGGVIIGGVFGPPLLILAAVLLWTRIRFRPEHVAVAVVIAVVLAIAGGYLVFFGVAAVAAAAILCWGPDRARVAIGALSSALAIGSLNIFSIAASGWTWFVLLGGVTVWAVVLSRPGFPVTRRTIGAT